MSKLMGIVIAILVIALLGATGYTGYDVGYDEGHRSGYYYGEQACIAEYEQAVEEFERMWSQRYSNLEHENMELRNIINQIETEMTGMKNQHPSSDFGGIEELLNLIWLFV